MAKVNHAFGMVVTPDGDGAEHMDEEGHEPDEAMDDEEEEKGEDGDKAAARSALADFAAAMGLRPKNLDKALEALEEVYEHCKG